MIGLDTNVLLRAALDDDPLHSPVARQIFLSLSDQRPGYISLVALLEFSWTLRATYRRPRTVIHAAIVALARNRHVVLAERRAVTVALKSRHLDFADALLRASSMAAGCTQTLTFDAKAARDPHFQLAGT